VLRTGVVCAIASTLALAVGAPTLAARQSVLFGVVKRGPITPVCRAESPCTGPAAGTTLVFRQGGHDVARATTKDDGSYRLRLAPGKYAVRVGRRRTFRPLDPASVTVRAGLKTRVNFFLDTGIR
jgi:carboxypeptidase family protein